MTYMLDLVGFTGSILGQRTKQDKGSMPSNDYPVAGQAALNLVMDSITDIRLPDVNDMAFANPDIGNSTTVLDDNTGY